MRQNISVVLSEKKISALLLLISFLLTAGTLQAKEAFITGLKAEFRHGQVFLCWKEPPGEHGGTFKAYTSSSPIISDNLKGAHLLAERIEAHSARDWWKDPATYFEEGQAEPQGFVIGEGSLPLEPMEGLFVHTVSEGEPERAYYAVTVSIAGEENPEIVPGENSLVHPVAQQVMSIQPVWLGKLEDKPSPGAAAGLPTVLHFHGRAGREPVSWLAFGTREMGWREGLPFKFYTEVREDYLLISPTDRTWIGRTLHDSWDKRDHFSPVIDTFWYGYNDHVYDRNLMLSGTPTNFTERRNLWIISWARDYFKPDPYRTVLEGGSMGGCGALSFGLRHPEIFSALVARVPLVGYFDEEWGGSQKRLTPFCGPLESKASDGVILRERMDSRTVLAQAGENGTDLPFLVISNARRDASIPWRPTPRYYQALNDSRGGFIAGWDNGVHSNCMENAHLWFKKWQEPGYLLRFSLEESFLAFSNCSLNNDPGNGDPEDGDITGYMNFGLEWKDIQDEVNQFSATIFVAAGEPEFPVRVDVTPRRLQRFRLGAMEKIVLLNQTLQGEEIIKRSSMADSTGLITFEQFLITEKQGNRLIIRKIK